MQDMFSGVRSAPVTCSDSFGEYIPDPYAEFYWIVAIFRSDGASEVINRAINEKLEVFYPYRSNIHGKLIPLWKNYLFVQYIEHLSVDVCRSSTKFIRYICMDDKPLMVKHNAIDECMELLKMGKYNVYAHKRKLIPAGSIVRIKEKNHILGCTDIKILCDITGDMADDEKVPIQVGKLSGKIQIGKLDI